MSASPHDTRAPWRRRAGWLGLLPVLIIHALFLLTYPLNSRGGDAANYLGMLVEGRSSLVHAGGYPFLMGLPFRVGPLAALPGEDPVFFERVLQVLQHTISLSASAILFVCVRRLFGSPAAVVAVVSYGTNLTFLGATSSAYPEWLQASLLILVVCSAVGAFLQQRTAWKLAGYAVSVVAFTWCVLVKFNALVFGVGFVIPMIAEGGRLQYKAVAAAGYVGLAFLNVAIYQYTFHAPTTGTARLTADTGWVLLTRAEHVLDNTLAPENGPATKRWLALASALPLRYDVAGPQMFSHINAVPAEIRTPFRRQFDQFMAVGDPFIDDWLRAHEVPEGFRVGVSVIPVCHYVGLLEGNDLAVRVAGEAIAAHPWRYLSQTAHDFGSALVRQHRPSLFPVASNGLEVAEELPGGRIRLRQPSRPWTLPFAYLDPVIWPVGLALFERLDEIHIPAVIVSALIAGAMVTAVFSAARNRRLGLESGVVVTLTLALATFLLASCFTLEFRWKELCQAMPLVSTLASVGLTWAPGEVARLIRANGA